MLGLTAADKLNNFEAISLGDLRDVPFRFGKDVQVVFDSHAAVVESELEEQVADRSANGSFVVLTIHLDDDGVWHEILTLRLPEVSIGVQIGDALFLRDLRRESPGLPVGR